MNYIPPRAGGHHLLVEVYIIYICIRALPSSFARAASAHYGSFVECVAALYASGFTCSLACCSLARVYAHAEARLAPSLLSC